MGDHADTEKGLASDIHRLDTQDTQATGSGTAHESDPSLDIRTKPSAPQLTIAPIDSHTFTERLNESLTALPPNGPDQTSSEMKILTEESHLEILAYAWPESRKWLHLSVVFLVQISMNFNASVVANSFVALMERFGASEVDNRAQMCAFLVAYAFGCELWAPWSEEYGRRWVLTISLGLVVVFALMCGFAPSYQVIVAGRVLQGLCSAGGSITLGVVADMYGPDDQALAVNFVVLASTSGSVVGPVVGGFLEVYTRWRWNFLTQAIFGLVSMLLFMALPETRAKVLLDDYAKKERARAERIGGKPFPYKGPGEVENIMSRHQIMTGHKETWQHIFTIWIRPFKMFVTEPIVLFLSLLSGFSDALIFTFLNSYGIVYKTPYKLGPIQIGLGFLFLLLGYCIGFAIHALDDRFRIRKRRARGKDTPEDRLYVLLYLAVLEPLGMFLFAYTSDPGRCPSPWVSLGLCTLVGIANYSIYQATIDYMVAAYGPLAASATGGNGFARDLLAGISALYAAPLYENIGSPRTATTNASIVLGCLAIVVIAPIYVFYFNGEKIRKHSNMAQNIQNKQRAREEKLAGSRRVSLEETRLNTDVLQSCSCSRRNSTSNPSCSSPPKSSAEKSRPTSPVKNSRPLAGSRQLSFVGNAIKTARQPNLLSPRQSSFVSQSRTSSRRPSQDDAIPMSDISSQAGSRRLSQDAPGTAI